MRNLFTLFWKYHFFLLFLFFESVCGFLIIRNNNYQNASFVNSANEVTANILSVVSNVTQYIGLRSENKFLAGENAQLRSLLPDAFYNDKVQLMTVRDSALHQHYQYIAAKVIGNSTGRRNNYLTLEAGSLKGVKPEMGVISSSGIVGIVKDVTENFCTVICVLHKEFHTSARLKKNYYFGNLEWQGGDPRTATLTDLPKHVPIHTGDTLITTAHSTIFPEGILIGTVNEFEIKPGDNGYTVKVNLSTDFNNLSYVYIVNDLFKQELKNLQQNLKYD